MKMKKLFTLFSLLLLAAVTTGVKAQSGYLITWDESDVCSAGSAAASYGTTDFLLTCVDTDGKHAIDANNANFGTAESYQKFTHRFKVGGKSSAKNSLKLTTTQAGTLKVYVRTGSNSATDRNLVLTQGDKELYNKVVQEADVVEITNDDQTTTKVYPVISVEVEAGDIEITYPTNGLNFYGFELELPVEEVSYYLMGSMNEWAYDDTYKMAPNPQTPGEYMLTCNLTKGTELKVSDGTNWYPYDAANYVVKKTGEHTVYFRPDGQGGSDWYYGYLYVTDDVEETPAEVSYYLVGNFNNWTKSDDYKLTPNAAAEGEYTISVTLAKGEEIKITSSEGDWYPTGMNNNYVVKVDSDDPRTLYFRPDGQGGEGWYEGFFFLENDEEETVEPVEDGFYLVGSFNNWTASADYKFTENAGQDGEYQLVRISLTAGDELKVVGKSATAGDIWYPGAEAGNYTVKKTGTHSIYFRPDGQGNDDWYCGVFYVDNDEAATGAFDLTSVAENGQVTFYVEGTVAESANAGVAVTANVEAAEGYVLNEETIKVEAYGKFEDAQGPQQAPAIGLLRDVDYTIADDVISFTMPEANVRVTVEFTVDKQELDNLIDDAKELVDELEDGDAKTELGTAITDAEGVMNDPNATPEDVQTAIDNLQDAIDKAKQELEGEEVEVTIAAGAFKTMYLEKKRTVKAAVEGVKLYTVTQVNADEEKAVLSAELEVVDAEKPFIIYNEGTTEATIVLSVATGTPTQVTIAPEFKGTLTDKTFTAADLEAADYYTLQGSNFLWAAEAGTIPANRCWIQLDKSAGSPASLSIVFGDDTTGIKSLTPALTEGEGVYYDLSGRRVAQPTKGLYIINGKKVVIK